MRFLILFFLLLPTFKLFAQNTAGFTVDKSEDCTPLAVKFHDISTGNIKKRIWNFGDGQPSVEFTSYSGGDDGPTRNFSNNTDKDTTYIVTLTIEFNDGTPAMSASQDIKVHPLPVADFDASTLGGCKQLTVNFTDKSKNGGSAITSWNWNFGAANPTTSSAQNPQGVVFANNGSYEVVFYVVNTFGCKSDPVAKQTINVYDKAVPSFTVDNQVSCDVPYTAKFTNTTTGQGNKTYLWDFGDGSTSTDESPSHPYTTKGTYYVSLKVNNGTNCTNSTAYNYKAIQTGTPALGPITNNGNVCSGTNATFSTTSDIPGVSVMWIISDGVTDDIRYTGTSLSYYFPAATVEKKYTITAQATSYGICTGNTQSTNIVVKATPIADFTIQPPTLCKEPFDVTFTNTSAVYSNNITYTWNYGDGSAAAINPTYPSHSYHYNSDGNKNVTLTAKDNDNGCSTDKSLPVDIRIPQVNIYNISPAEICEPPVDVTAYASASNVNETIQKYIWDFGDGTPASIEHPSTLTYDNATATFTSSGAKNISVKLVTVSGCEATFTKSITISDDCSGDGGGSGGGGFNSSNTCANKQEITFTDQYSIDNPTKSKVTSWDFGDGAIINTDPVANPITHTYAATTNTYTVKMTRAFIDAKGKIRSEVITQTVDVINETAKFDVGKIKSCTEEIITFVPDNAIKSQYISKYEWNFGDGSPTAIINNTNFSSSFSAKVTHAYNNTGTYTAKLTITDKSGCTSTDTLPQEIKYKTPTADFDIADAMSCKEVNFTKNATDLSNPGSSAIVKWDWYIWNTGATVPGHPNFSLDASTIANPIQLPFSNTTNAYLRYSVKLAITDENGCSTFATKRAIVQSFWPKADFYSNNTLQCNNYNVYLNNTSSGSSLNYAWDFGDGSNPLLNGTYPHKYAGDGTYTVSLAVAEKNMPTCTDTKTAKDYITITKPVADFDVSDLSDCAPVAISFTDKSTYATSYSWDFGDGSPVSTDKNPVGHIYQIGGNYTVKLTIKGLSGCEASVTKSITIKGPSGVLSYDKLTGCIPFDVTASVAGVNVSNYAWDFIDGISSPNVAKVTHTYNKAGIRKPNVVLYSSDGCKLKLEFDKEVIADDINADFSIDKTTFCYSADPVFTNHSTVPDFSSITEYLWSFGDNTTSDVAQPGSHTYPVYGTYNVSLKVVSRYGSCTATKTDIVNVYAAPSAIIEGNDVVCLSPENMPSLNYKADVQSSNVITNYTWKLDNNSTGSNSETLSADYRVNGQHTITLIATTDKGCADTVSKNIIIDSVKTGFEILNPAVCLTGNYIQLKNNSTSPSSVSYLWNYGDGNASADPNHTYTNAGSYDIKLIGASEYGCKDSATILQAVKLYMPPAVSITGDNEVCENGKALFTAVVNSEDEITGYKWFVNDVQVANAYDNTLNYLFTVAGIYSIKTTVQTSHGCEESATWPVTVNALPNSVTKKDTAICKGNTIQLYASGGVNYRWYATDPFFDNGESENYFASVTPMVNTKFYVDIKNQFGCSKKDSVLVTVKEPGGLTVCGDTGVCPGNSVRLWAKSTVKKYEWQPAESLNRNNIYNPIAKPDSITTYTVTAFSENVCPDEQKNVTVTIYDVPTVSLGVDQTLQAGQLITLTPLTSDNVASYKWMPETGLTCYDCANPLLKADNDITYTVTVKTIYGCEASDDIAIKVLCGNGAVAIPNAFTPNGDGNNDVFYIMGWGIQSVKSLRIYDRWGKLVFIRENIKANDKSNGWDGKINGMDVLQTTTFVYITDVICNEGKLLQYKGTVILVK